MLKTYKYRIFPNEKQEILLANIFGQVRFVYNLALETKICAYNGQKARLSCFDLINQVVKLKNAECPWLKDAPAQALQMSLRNLDSAYMGFFKGKGFPKFKSKHSKQSFQLPQGVYLSDDKKQIFIPKLRFVGIDLHREFKGKIKTVTVSKTPTNKYFISIVVDNEKVLPNKKSIQEPTSIGVDLGIKHFAVCSSGQKFDNQEFFKSNMQRLRVEQRSLARKQKGSKRREKQRLKLALIHEKIRNQRQDYLHKISKYLVDNYDTICLEDLSVKNMSSTCQPIQDKNGKFLPNGQSKKSKLNRSILDMGWSEFRSMLEYKAEWQGKNIKIIDRFEPSSKMCNCCGNINQELTLNDRNWTCPSCKIVHDRDTNASINIKNFGLRNKPSVAQSGGLPRACSVEVH